MLPCSSCSEIEPAEISQQSYLPNNFSTGTGHNELHFQMTLTLNSGICRLDHRDVVYELCSCFRLTEDHKVMIRVIRKIKFFVARRKFQVLITPSSNYFYPFVSSLIFYLDTNKCGSTLFLILRITCSNILPWRSEIITGFIADYC